MKRRLAWVLMALVALLACAVMLTACGGDDLSDDESTTEKKSETKTITSIECANELNAVLDKMLAQKTVSYTEEYTDDDYGEYKFRHSVYTAGESCYVNYYQYQSGGTYQEENWWGYVDGEYVQMYANYVSGERYYNNAEECSAEREIKSMLNAFDYFVYLVENAAQVECVKTASDVITYQVKIVEGEEVYNVTITVRDNLLLTLVCENTDCNQSFSYDVPVEMPSKADYTKQEISK